MKIKDIQSLHKKTSAELEKMFEDQQKELVEAKIKLTTGKLKNVHEVKRRRHDLARIKTIIAEKK